MFIIYDFIFLIIALMYFPVYLLRRKFHKGFGLRLGFLPKNLDLDRPIWVHAVSVGEALVVKGLVQELRKNYPAKKIVISTVTVTGNKIVSGYAAPGDFVTYLPLDFSFITAKVIKKINPSLFIVAETELWPNLIRSLYKNKIPIITVNGRISDNSFKGYKKIKFLMKNIFRKINVFCAQSYPDAERLKRLGVESGKIKVTGNMKFDSIGYAGAKKDYTPYKLRLSLRYGEKLFTAGSTHPGEEEIILYVYKELLKSHANLRLLVAPRHPERASEIIGLINKYGFEALRLSQLGPSSFVLRPSPVVFILDTVGELLNFYAVSDIVFVGGSMVKAGGHNILEPAYFSKPVLFGPNMPNFRDIAALFLNNKAGIMVRNKEELKNVVSRLLNNPAEGVELGRRAALLIGQNQGATKKNMECIKILLQN